MGAHLRGCICPAVCLSGDKSCYRATLNCFPSRGVCIADQVVCKGGRVNCDSVRAICVSVCVVSFAISSHSKTALFSVKNQDYHFHHSCFERKTIARNISTSTAPTKMFSLFSFSQRSINICSL